MSYTLSDETGKLIDNNYIWSAMNQQYSDYYNGQMEKNDPIRFNMRKNDREIQRELMKNYSFSPPVRRQLPSDLLSSIINFASRPVAAVAPVVAPVVAPMTALERLRNQVPTYDASHATPESFKNNYKDYKRRGFFIGGQK